MDDIVEFSKQDAWKVDQALNRFNDSVVPFTQKDPFVRLSYGVRGDGESIVGGVGALLYAWGILYVDALWVDERLRQRGLGTQLLHRVESEAKKHGCTLVHLDTFDFQAREFYERNGYDSSSRKRCSVSD